MSNYSPYTGLGDPPPYTAASPGPESAQPMHHNSMHHSPEFHSLRSTYRRLGVVSAALAIGVPS